MNNDFIERLPSGWTSPPVYARYSVQLGKMLDEKRIVGSNLAPYLRNLDVQWEGINTTDLPLMDFSEKDRKRYALQEGDLLVCEGGEVGRTAIWNGELDECFFQKAVHRLRPTSEQDEPRFFRYFMRMAVDAGLFTLRTASTIPHLTAEQLRVVRFPAPPRPQQRAIADYLDRETARIDALIAAKERVLGLLAEKRRALITRAVTRGLDPHAPVRDSGIPRLGEIPAHWRRAQLRRFIQFITSGSRGWAEHYSDSGALFVRIGNLTRDSVRLDLSDVQYVEPPEGAEGERTRVRLGDLLFSITAYLGSIALVDHDIEEAYVNQHIALVRLDQSRGLLAQYAAYAALSNVGQTQLVAQSYGGTKTQLALDDVRELWFPVPPADEQAAIVDFVEASLATLNRLEFVAEATVRLLKERRSALIAAAVTGQIDVEAVA